MRAKVSDQDAAPVSAIEFAGRFHNADRDLYGIFNVVQGRFCFHDDFEKLILKHIPLILFLRDRAAFTGGVVGLFFLCFPE